jgi:hypothetical protein
MSDRPVVDMHVPQHDDEAIGSRVADGAQRALRGPGGLQSISLCGQRLIQSSICRR